MRKVLVADADPLIRRLASNSLTSQEFLVHEAEDGEACLQEARSLQPSLILLDLHLPKLGGEQLCTSLVQACPEAHLVLLVGQGPEDEPVEACLKFAQARLDKPFSPMGLIRLVHRLGGSGGGSDSGERPLHDLERQQLLLYARDLARLRKEDVRKTRELREAKRRLEQLEKDKDMFLALVSHELRTPLTIIKGHARLLKRVLEQSPLQERLGDFPEALVEASDRLERLILEMLSYSGMRTGLAPFEVTPVSLGQLLSGVLTELQTLAGDREVSLELSFERDPVLKADAGRLQEAFSHLVKNGIHFNRPGGRVTITCEELDQGVRVLVSDTGIGMALEEQEKVFLPFYQAQDVLTRRVEGLGLGLAITRHILEGHGGHIALESQPGQGTRVKVFLPWEARQEGELQPPPVLPPEPRAQEADAIRAERQLLQYSRELYAAYDQERNRRLQAEEMHRELERTFVETLATVMRALEQRTAHQTEHLDRVAFYAQELARRIDPNLPNRRDFRYALLLHDVGQILVAEALFQKVGQLTGEEQELLRSHTSVGAELLDSIAFLRPALEGVRHHHERWDGQGYPDGLQGTDIPLSARIIAVADSFDAMTVDRPYRKAMTPEEARRVIVSEAGRQYDPGVVKAFEALWETLARYCREHVSS